MSCLSDDAILALGDADDPAWEHVAGCALCSALVAAALGPSTITTAHDRGYALGRELARGGMGRVLRAHDAHLGRPVAIKMSTVGSAVNEARFQREIELTARLQHPNIIPIYDAGELDGAAFYTMRPVSGQRLDERIATARTRDQRLELLPHVLALVDAVAYAHRQGVIHRDLKPQNVLVGEFGETVVIDWGLGKELGEHDETSPEEAPADLARTAVGSVVGTPGYMAPEQARGEPTDRRTDVYALGCILFQTLTGEPPRTGSSEAAIIQAAEGESLDVQRRAPHMPPELRAIIGKATDPLPAHRYADAGELGADLRRYQAGLLVAAHHYAWHHRLARGLARHRLAVAVVASVVVSGALVGGLAIHKVVAERDRANTERRAADDLLGFLVDDLPDKLAGIGHLDVLDAAGARLDAYFSAVRPARAEAGQDVVRLAQVRSVRAQVASITGHPDKAVRLSGEAVDLARRGHAPDILAQLLVARATVLQTNGQSPEARKAFEEANALLASLPATPERKHLVAVAASHLASEAIADGNLDETKRWVTTARAALPADTGDFANAMLDSAIAYVDAQRQWAVRDLPGARAGAERSVAAAKLAARRSPWRSDAQDQVAASESLLGGVLTDAGDLAGAAAALDHAISVLRSQLEAAPRNVAERVTLASTLGDLAAIREQQNIAGAEAARSEAIQILDDLLAREPANTSWRALEIRLLREGSNTERAEALAAQLPADQRACTLVDIERDRALDALSHHDAATARSHLDRASQVIAAMSQPPPECARFQPFEVLIDRITATPDQRGSLLEQARAMAAKLKAEGIDAAVAATLQQKIDEAARGK